MRTRAHIIAAVWTVASGALLAIVALALDGASAAAGVAFGAAAVVLFLSSGLIALRMFGRTDVPGGMGLVVLLLSYLLRLVLVLTAAAVIARTSGVDGRWLGIGLMVCAVAWIVAHTWTAWRRSKTELTIEPDSGSETR